MERNIFQVIWFILWGILWGGYFVLDGFDLGAGTIFSFITKDETERRMVYNAIGPFWDANEVWLITAGGATFAAFPRAYAIMFSGLYSALLLFLFCLILRGVSIEFRGRGKSSLWRGIWDLLFSISSFTASLFLGVAFSNIFRGLPIDKSGLIKTGLVGLLNPYGLLGGVFFVVMFSTHGTLWLYKRTGGPLRERARKAAMDLWMAELVLGLTFMGISLRTTHLWDNYRRFTGLFVIPFLAVATLLSVPVFLKRKSPTRAFVSSCLFVLFTTFWCIAGLFPNIMPSSIDPRFSVTIYNSSSSFLTLKIMTVVALIFIPIMLCYKFWLYRTFSEKLSPYTHEEGY